MPNFSYVRNVFTGGGQAPNDNTNGTITITFPITNAIDANTLVCFSLGLANPDSASALGLPPVIQTVECGGNIVIETGEGFIPPSWIIENLDELLWHILPKPPRKGGGRPTNPPKI